MAVSAVIERRPLTIRLSRLSGIRVSRSSRLRLMRSSFSSSRNNSPGVYRSSLFRAIFTGILARHASPLQLEGMGITNNEPSGRFEVAVDDGIGLLRYRIEVPAEARGRVAACIRRHP
jgi:hypothetical protein